MDTYKQFLRAQEDWLDPDRHNWSVDDEYDVYDDEPLCEHCQAQGTEEHNGGCPNGDELFVAIGWYEV